MTARLTLTALFRVPPPRLSDHFDDDERDGGPRCPCNDHPAPCVRCRAEFDAYREDAARTRLAGESRLETELRWSLRMEALEKKVKELSHMVPA